MASNVPALRLSWRIGLPNILEDGAFANLLAFAQEYARPQTGAAPVVDEISLFDTLTHHLYAPLPDLAARAGLMGRRVRALKDAGIASVGINVLNTMGQINEAWDTMPPLPFQPMVGHDGSVSKSCACPNTPELRDYVRAKYTLFAQAAPDFVWVDDDIRMHHHGVTCACFCPTCLALFAQEYGERFTRQELVAALNDPARGDLRQAWIRHNSDTIVALLALVRQTVNEVDPHIPTGLMTIGPYWAVYSGMDLPRWFTALGATKARPGGGFYSDAGRLELINKALDSGKQRSTLPASVTDRQYELENFPYQMLKKSVSTVLNECTFALAMGMNGIAFNALGWYGDLDEYRAIPERAAEMRPLWEALVAHVDGLPTAGLWPAWSTQLMARRSVRPGEDWFTPDRRHDIYAPHALAEIGLPLGVDSRDLGVLLSGRVAEAFTDDDLRGMLAGGVILDGEALAVLWERGLGDLTGVRLAQRMDNGVLERFTADELNGAAAGSVRDARIEFGGAVPGLADILEPVAPGVRVLSEIQDYLLHTRGPGMTAFANRLGGRVCVLGYAPWIFIHTAAKRAQLQNVADWITCGRLPVRIAEAVPLTPIVRLSADGKRGAVVLLNHGLDAIPRATLHLRTAASPVRLLTPAGAQPLAAEPEAGGQRVVLRDIAPWSTACLLLG